MDFDDPLVHAIAEWQRKHRLADGDPMIAALNLSAFTSSTRVLPTTSFEDFRSTIELLDRRSKPFITQASDLRRFAQNVERLNRVRFATPILQVFCATVTAVVVGRYL
jgi:hypothetical protein